MVGSQVQAAHGCDGMIYITLASLEELLEMLGMILLIYDLLCHLAWMRAERLVGVPGACGPVAGR